jgi:hypothetical protein
MQTLQKTWTFFFSLLSYQKNDYDKPKVKELNDPLQCEGWKTQKALVVLHSAKKQKNN